MREHDRNDDIGLTPAERELEAALAGLAPARADRVDPLAAAFTAGRTASRREARAWRSAAAVMLVIGAGGWLTAAAMRSGAHPPTRPDGSMLLVKSEHPAAPQQHAKRPEPAPAQSWLMLRGAALDSGLERLPPSPPAPATQMMRPADVL
jgi:hypothetical protein